MLSVKFFRNMYMAEYTAACEEQRNEALTAVFVFSVMEYFAVMREWQSITEIIAV